MKVFVTGSSGFVGSHVCDWFQQKNHQVWGLYRNSNKREEMGACGEGIEGTLSTSEKHGNVWLDELPPDLDAVVHVAGQTLSFRAQEFFDINQTATCRLILDLRERFPGLRFTLISSLAASGPSTTPKSEGETEHPVSNYGRSKLEAEHSLQELAPDTWQLAIVRPPIVIGPRDPGMLDLFKMVQKRIMILPGWNGNKKPFSYVGVRDLSEVIGRSVTQSLPNRPACYFSAFPRTVTFLEIMQSVRRTMGSKRVARANIPIPIMWLIAGLGKMLYHCGLPRAVPLTPDKVREAGQVGWVCSSQRSMDELGIEYHDHLDDIVDRTYADYQKRGWL